MKLYSILFFCVISFQAWSQSGFVLDSIGVSKFKEVQLPLNFQTEDYSVYRLFDGYKLWDVNAKSLSIERKGCKKKYGYRIAQESNFTTLIYPFECGESVIYYLSTFKPDGSLISTLEVMGLYNDDESMNGYISDTLGIKLVKRTLLMDTEQKADVKSREVDLLYCISKEGLIEQISSSKEEIRYYNLDNKGKFIRVN